MDKEYLRNYFLSKRRALTSSEAAKKSDLIFEALTHSDSYKLSSTIHCYIPITKNREVDTTRFIQKAITDGKKVSVPKITGKNQLTHYYIQHLDNLHLNSWGVAEPQEGEIALPTDFDLIVVPMVAGDMFKNRLGYGKGFYDRFLTGLDTYTAGVLFDCQIFDKQLPTESFDVPLQGLYTESAIIE